MGISPITNLTPLRIARPLYTDLDPAPMERVDSLARLGDETYSPSDGKAAEGGEDEAGDREVESKRKFGQELANLGLVAGGSLPMYSGQGTEAPRVSFFA